MVPARRLSASAPQLAQAARRSGPWAHIVADLEGRVRPPAHAACVTAARVSGDEQLVQRMVDAIEAASRQLSPAEIAVLAARATNEKRLEHLRVLLARGWGVGRIAKAMRISTSQVAALRAEARAR
jgi:hypothetical protein